MLDWDIHETRKKHVLNSINTDKKHFRIEKDWIKDKKSARTQIPKPSTKDNLYIG